MNYSIEQMHDFLESMAKGSTWAEAIQKVLKMDEQTYYGQIAEYLADELEAGRYHLSVWGSRLAA